MKYVNHILLVLILCVIVDWAADIGMRVSHADYQMYCKAAEGDVHVSLVLPNGNRAPWLYADPLHPLFLPLTHVTASQWFFIELIAVIFLVLKTFERTPYAWIILLAASTACCASLASGNIGPILALMCISPFGAAVVCVFKPYTFLLVLAFVARRSVEIYHKRKPVKAHK